MNSITTALTAREIDQLEDSRILSLARALGLSGVETARAHTLTLAQRVHVALTAGAFDDAVWYAEREFEFVSRYYGLSHQYSRASLLSLEMIRDHRRIMSDEIETYHAPVAA